MKLSVVISTYNSPLWLEKVLWGYSIQTHPDFEILIADDGSGPETANLINDMRTKTGLEIHHVWHEDQGFRKCTILNKTIKRTSSEYIVFTDGDCIPRKDFLQTHAGEAKPGYFLSGGYHKLPLTTSKTITKEDILSQNCFDLYWLKKHDLPSSHKNTKLTATPLKARILNYLTPTKCNFKGSNSSAWRDDLLTVNGFDERMAWGGEDRELGVRLNNAGIKPRHVRYNAIVVHLDHTRGYVDANLVSKNKELRRYNEDHKVAWTDHGIKKS
ncbi:MAG: glycosyltransferase family 2 protein [Pseudomonadota bacterium]